MQFRSDFLEFILLLLDLFCFDFDVFFFLLEFFDIFQDGVVEVLSAIVFELLVGLIFVDVYYFLLYFWLFLYILR